MAPSRLLILVLAMGALIAQGCASLMSSATSGMAENLGAAIRNQDDPATVRDGAPAYLLMLDSLLESSPDDVGLLISSADLYAAYGVLFTDDPERAARLTNRALDHGQRALCVAEPQTCGMHELAYPEYAAILERVPRSDFEPLFTYGQSWLAWIRIRSDDMGALAKLPRAEAVFQHIHSSDESFRSTEVNHYLAVLETIRPPALGGDFESGREHFEQALAASEGRDLSIYVDYARYYARTLYEKELHDRLLNEALEADPVQPGHTLFNVLAKQQARELLASSDDHF